ncbi:MAG: hypothetical protein JWO38_3550 [Gemmataceae bacterium]|nr:hypothetical protein [Gemmataceae bacterium]
MCPLARNARTVLIILVTISLIPACSKLRPKKVEAVAEETDPLSKAGAVGKRTDPGAPFPASSTPKEVASRWGSTAIPIDHQTGVSYGPPGCPVAVIGTDVYDLKTYKAIRTLPDKYEAQALHALTGDGRYFASASKSPNQTDTAVTVWASDTGKTVLQVPGQKEAFVDVLAFAHNQYLLLGGRHGPQIDVWDVEKGKVVGQLTVPEQQVRAEKLAFSPDSKYFAHLGHDKLVVIDAGTNKQVAVMAPPADGQGPGGGATFIYAWSQGLAFSPDGSELALFSAHPTSPKLVVWNTRGERVLDAPVMMPPHISHKHVLEWLPDGSGWLINRYLFDRTTRRVVVSIRIPFASNVLPHIVDKNRVIGIFGQDTNRLQTITLPWEKLDAALKAMAGGSEAYIAPGAGISLDLVLTGLRGDETETRRTLSEALTSRLARDRVTVAQGQPTILRLKLAEEAGESLPIFQRQSPFDFRGQDTGRKATEAKGSAVLELIAAGEPQPLWRGNLSASSSRSFQDEINDATVRKSMLEHLTRQLNGTDLPYFIPKSKDILALPAVVE